MSARKVVFAPDILVSALYDPRARDILNRWRDGQILPVVTRDLLLIYLRALGKAGLTPELIRKWSLWLTSPGRSLYIDDVVCSQSTGLVLCREIACAQKAELLTL